MKGREIRDFVNAFGIGALIGDRWAQRANDRERIEMERERTEGWKSNPEVKGIDAELRRRRSATGSLPQMPRQATRSPTPLVPGAMEPMSIQPSSLGGIQPVYAGGGLVDAIFPTQSGEAQRIADLEAIQASKRLRRATENIPSDVTETGEAAPERLPPQPPPNFSQRLNAAIGPIASNRTSILPPKPSPGPGETGGAPLVEPAAFREPYTPPGPDTASLPEYERPGDSQRYMRPLGATQAVTQPGNTPSAGGAGSSATAATATPGSTAPAAGGGSTGGSTGGPARRKNLNDQTRTEAFDPDNEQDWAQADERVKAAIKGGMQFAAQQFHLANPNDPNHQEGKMMFFRGTGAPDPQTMQALDQTIQQQAPVAADDPFGTAKLQLRRMTIAYEWYASRGEFDRANKMAFEMMQYSRMAVGQLAGSAAGMVQQDPQRAVGVLAQALDAIPDGYKVVAGPNGTIQYYAANGRPLQTVQMTPQKLLATANGLADGTLYWQILNERANMVPGVAKDATAASKAAVDAKRIELMDARIKKLGQPSGRAGRAGPPPVDRYDDMLGRLSMQGAVSPDYQGRAREPAQGSNDGGGEAPDSKEPDPAVEELRSQLREEIEANADNALIGEGDHEGGTLGTTNNPAAEPGGVTKPAPASPLRLKPARPDQGVYVPKSTTDAAPTAPTEPAKRPVDGTVVPDQVVGAKPKAQTPQFNKPHPMAQYGMKDPYAQMLAGVDPTTGKPDPALREKMQNNRKFRADVVRLQGILRQQVSDYNRERKEFEAKAVKANAPGRAEPAVKPSTVKAVDDMADSIRTSVDELVKDKKPSPFNDGFSKPEDLGEIAMEIATSNHNMPTKRAVQIVGDLMRAGTEQDERTLRAFKPLGRDESGQYVFLSPLSDPTRKIKMHKDAYDRMNALIEQRWTMRQKQGSTKGGSWGAVGDVVFPPNTRRKPSSPFLLN